MLRSLVVAVCAMVIGTVWAAGAPPAPEHVAWMEEQCQRLMDQGRVLEAEQLRAEVLGTPRPPASAPGTTAGWPGNPEPALPSAWGTATRISNTSSSSYTYAYGGWSIAADNNNVQIAWYDYTFSPYYIRHTSFPIGVPPVTPVQGDAISTTYGYYPSIAVSNNNVHVTWYYASSPYYLNFREKLNNTTWQPIIQFGVPSMSCYYPAIADDAAGNSHVVYNQYVSGTPYGYRVMYQRRNSGAGSFTSPVQVSQNIASPYSYYYYPSIAASGSNVYATWGYYPNYQLWFNQSTNGGVTWGAPVQIASNVYYSYPSSICVDKTGNLYVAYIDYSSPYQVYVIKRTGTTWGAPVNVSNREPDYCYMHPSICADTLGNIWVAFQSYGASTNNYYEVFYNMLPAGSSTWSGTQQLTTNDSYSSYYAQICADRKGNVHLDWTDFRDVGAGSPEVYYNWNQQGGGPAPLPDAALAAITAPPDTVLTGLTYTPACTVQNVGNVAITFPVLCRIASAGFPTYSNIQNVSSLAVGAKRFVPFANWTVNKRAGLTWTVTDTTQLTGDVQSANDRKTKTVYAKGDVGVIEAIEPLDTVYVGKAYTPTVKIRNFLAGYTEVFPITCRIVDDGGNIVFEDSQSDSLLPDEVKMEFFEEWFVTGAEGVTYEIQVWTALPGDFTPANDLYKWTVVTATTAPPPVRDVGTAALDEPSADVTVGVPVTPKATVKNFGNLVATFDVHCTIGAYTNTKTVTDLAADSLTQVVFDSWTPPAEGTVEMRVYTDCVGDGNPTNDTLAKQVTVVPAGGTAEPARPVPASYALTAVYPNPAAAAVRIEYALPAATRLALRVYNATGILVRTIAIGTEPAGYHAVRWDGRDASGQPVANGLYFVRLESVPFAATSKLLVLR